MLKYSSISGCVCVFVYVCVCAIHTHIQFIKYSSIRMESHHGPHGCTPQCIICLSMNYTGGFFPPGYSSQDDEEPSSNDQTSRCWNRYNPHTCTLPTRVRRECRSLPSTMVALSHIKRATNVYDTTIVNTYPPLSLTLHSCSPEMVAVSRPHQPNSK